MPVYQLGREMAFPSPDLSEPDGLVAVGGDLSEERLLLAYSLGIFPWYCEGQPILWWSPDPRLVLLPGELKVSRSLRQKLKKRVFRVTFDTAFDEVVSQCARVHTDSEGCTWITADMKAAYSRLHQMGFAHSVESWLGDRMAGGLYGVSLGRAFFGESMFSLEPDSSKVALDALVRRLEGWGFELIDCQVSTRHLKSLGAREIPRGEFLLLLKEAVRKPPAPRSWK